MIMNQIYLTIVLYCAHIVPLRIIRRIFLTYFRIRPTRSRNSDFQNREHGGRFRGTIPYSDPQRMILITKNLVIHYKFGSTELFRTFIPMAKKTYARIELKVPPAFKERVTKVAEKNKQSVNRFIEAATEEKMDKIEDDSLKDWLNS
jgi:hypothetical protein